MRELLPQLEPGLAVLVVTPLLLLLFVFLVWGICHRSRRELYEQLSRIPLSDDKNALGEG